MSLFLNTTKNTFEGKRDNETVLFLIRRHYFILLSTIIGFAALTMILLSLFAYFYNYLLSLGLITLAWFISVLLISAIWHALFYRVMDYLLDTWIVTDQRIIDSQQLGFFRRRVVQTEMDKIQDVTTEINSMVPTILNFGNVEVQTAGAKEKIFIKQVPNPNVVAETLMKISKELRAKDQHSKTNSI